MRAGMTPVYTVLAMVLGGWVAVGCSTEPESRLGSAGETCGARADCQSGLACINERCVPGIPLLSVTGKACHRVECADDAGCCRDFVPASGCDLYERACQANPNDCEAFRTLCQCNRVCRNELCMDVEPGCAADAECPASSSPYCVERRCVECREHGDCPDSKGRCVGGTCQAPCRTDENCPLLQRCNSGTCEPSGCTSDRECGFVLENPRGRCSAGSCFVACAGDADCSADDFETCVAGRCIFIGCRNDAECRAYLDLGNTSGEVRAVCR